MKNKGYTLLELLGVMVILALLVTLAFPTIINFIKKGNDKTDQINNDLIISAASKYINDNASNLYLTSGAKHCVSVDTLIEGNYLKITEEDNYINKSVKVTYDKKLKYEIVEKEDCYICRLVSGEANIIGSKYQCKVKENMEEGFEDGYYFHILSYNADETTNLIMDRNMYYDSTNDVGQVATSSNPGLVEWYAPAYDNSYGPVTAMTYLHNATKDWHNVPNMIMDYEDENIESSTQQKGTYGYGSIKTTANITTITRKSGEETGRIENLKSRIPRYDEVHGSGKCLTYAENGNEYGSCPLWLSNYLSNSEYVTGEGLQNINGVKGYWLLASNGDYSFISWSVYYDGYMNYYYEELEGYNGIRPVITIPNEYLQ